MIHFGWTGENRPSVPGLDRDRLPRPVCSRAFGSFRPALCGSGGGRGTVRVRRRGPAGICRRRGASRVRCCGPAGIRRRRGASRVRRFESSPCPDGRVWLPAGITLPLSDSSDTGTLSGSPLPASSPPSTNSSVSYCLVSGSSALPLSPSSPFSPTLMPSDSGRLPCTFSSSGRSWVGNTFK